MRGKDLVEARGQEVVREPTCAVVSLKRAFFEQVLSVSRPNLLKIKIKNKRY